MGRLTEWWQHYGNPLHVYCRMRDLGVGKRRAVKICTEYEKWWKHRAYLKARSRGHPKRGR